MRKKFTMLLAALFLFLGAAVAQQKPLTSTGDVEYHYYIRNARNGDYYVTTTKGLKGGAQQLGSANSFSESKAKVAFKLLEGGKIVSVNTDVQNLYLGYTTTEKVGNCVQLFKEDNSYTWALEKRMNMDYSNRCNGYAIIPGSSGHSLNMHGGAGQNIGLWDKTDGGGVWLFEPANGNAIIAEAEALYATSLSDKIGEYTYANPADLAVAIEAAKEEQTEDNIAALQTAIANKKMNLLKDGKYYLISSSLAAFPETKAVYCNGDVPSWKTLIDGEKSFYWQAVATGDGGIVLKNAETGKYLVGNSATSQPWETTDNYSDDSKLSIEIFGQENEKGYEYGIIMCGREMHMLGHSNGNGINGTIVSYNETKVNTPSSWFIQEFDELPIPHNVTYKFSYKGNAVEGYDVTYAIKHGSAYPNVDISVFPYGVILASEKPEGTVTKDEVCTIVLDDDPRLQITDNVENITWYYARMQHFYPGYLGDIAVDNNTIYVGHNKSSDEFNEKYLWGFVGDVFNGVTVVNKGTGLKLNASGSGNVTLSENGTEFMLVKPISGVHREDGFCLRIKGSNQHVNANHDVGVLSHWTDNDAGSTMFVTKYVENEISVSDVNWATMYLDYAAYIPEGVNAYTVTGVEEGYVTLTQLEGVIPANTGVILENKGNYTFKMAAKDNASAEGNLLQGSVENSYVEGAAYVLAKKNDVVGLYKATLNKNANGEAGDSHFLNNAGKAYLPASAVTSNAAMFSFNRGQGTTSIEDVELTIDNVVIYDITGRRVEKMEKGIYIVNGKKVFVK